MKPHCCVFVILLLCFISILNGQRISSFQPLPTQDNTDLNSYPIPGCRVLWQQEMMLNKYVSEHPEVLEAKHLAKVSAWNFNVGDRRSWWATNLVSNTEYQVPSTCRAVGTNAYYFVEDSVWNSGRVNQTAVDSILSAFEVKAPSSSIKGIYQLDIETFGNPPNVDNDSKVIILILDIKDSFSGSGAYTAGYFFSLNEYPEGSVAGRHSNFGEIYYLDAYPANLTTPNGRSFAAATTAHEFQHMIHFNYDPYELTFVNESCSTVAELVCGYSMDSPSLYTNNTDVYLLGWNGMLEDYSRAQRWALYLWNQFPNGFLKQLVANTATGIAGINNALALYAPVTTRRFSDIFKDWLVANQLNDASVDAKYSYTYSSSMTKPTATVYPTTYSVLQTTSINRLAADYVTFNSGSNLNITFSSGSSSVSVKAIESGLAAKRVLDVPIGSVFTEPGFGTTYSSITFVVINSSQTDNASYTYQTASGGGLQTFETKYDNGIGLGSLTDLSTNDTASVYFDAIPGATLDSIRIAFSLPGSISVGLYRYTGALRPTPLGLVVVPMSTLTVPFEMMNFTPTSEGTTKWVTKDLRGYSISAGESFVVAATLGAIPTIPGLLVTQEAYTGSANHSYTYLNNPSGSSSPNWFFISGSGSTVLYLYMIRAYSHTGTASVPSTPVLSSPAHQSTGISTSPTLIWNASTGANSYHLQVSSASSFTTTVVDDSTLVGTSRPVGPLSSNMVYYWRMSAKNIYGTSSYSPIWSFTSGVAAPAIPALALPANGATNQPINTTLSWNTSTRTKSYRLQVSTSSFFSTTVLDDSTITDTTRTVGPLQKNTMYYWRVGAKNDGGISAWSVSWNYSTVHRARGDVDGNGVVQAYDAGLVLRHVAGIALLADPEALYAADASGNSEITAYDAALILQAAVGLITLSANVADGGLGKAAVVQATGMLEMTSPEATASSEVVKVKIKLSNPANLYSVSTVTKGDFNLVSIDAVNAKLPEGWQMQWSVVGNELRIAAAGTTPLPAGGIATIMVRMKSKESRLSISTDALLNENFQSLGAVEVASIPAVFALEQNYPNPFNPSTTISYSIPRAANVSLRIFNALGQEVAWLVNELKDAGYYPATWKASNVPSGIYFYRLQAGEFVETRKMILLR